MNLNCAKGVFWPHYMVGSFKTAFRTVETYVPEFLVVSKSEDFFSPALRAIIACALSQHGIVNIAHFRYRASCIESCLILGNSVQRCFLVLPSLFFATASTSPSHMCRIDIKNVMRSRRMLAIEMPVILKLSLSSFGRMSSF